MMVSLLFEADTAVGLFRATVNPQSPKPIDEIERVKPNHTELICLFDMDEFMLQERLGGALFADKDEWPERDRRNRHKEGEEARDTTLIDDLCLHTRNP